MSSERCLDDPQLFFNVVESFVDLPSSARFFVLAVVGTVFNGLDLLEKVLKRVLGLLGFLRLIWLLRFHWVFFLRFFRFYWVFLLGLLRFYWVFLLRLLRLDRVDGVDRFYWVNWFDWFDWLDWLDRVNRVRVSSWLRINIVFLLLTVFLVVAFSIAHTHLVPITLHCAISGLPGNKRATLSVVGS